VKVGEKSRTPFTVKEAPIGDEGAEQGRAPRPEEDHESTSSGATDPATSLDGPCRAARTMGRRDRDRARQSRPVRPPRRLTTSAPERRLDLRARRRSTKSPSAAPTPFTTRGFRHFPRVLSLFRRPFQPKILARPSSRSPRPRLTQLGGTSKKSSSRPDAKFPALLLRAPARTPAPQDHRRRPPKNSRSGATLDPSRRAPANGQLQKNCSRFRRPTRSTNS